MSATKIEWCDFTINPVVGCSHCSPGCDNCYAERFAARLVKNPATRLTYKNAVDAHGCWTGKISCVESTPEAFDDWWDSRLRRMKKGSRVFVGSMTDLFHEDGLTFEGLLHLWEMMDGWPEHIFCILTKRPERMREFALLEDHSSVRYPLRNVWLGVTVCNQAEADEKIPLLLQTPAAKRGVCVEPMLGPVDLTKVRQRNVEGYTYSANALTGFWYREKHRRESRDDYLSSQGAMNERLPALDWIICGGETGPGARPMHPDWVRSLRDQCQGAGVPFFLKSWGEWLPIGSIDRGEHKAMEGHGFDWKAKQRYLHPDGNDVTGHENGWINANIAVLQRVGKRRAGRLLDGREWNEVPS